LKESLFFCRKEECVLKKGVNNMIDLYDKVCKTIKQYNMINEGELVLVGVSGGPDSIALLHLLVRLKKELPFDLHAAHLDHSFRGRQAEEEALWVKKTAEGWGIGCTLAKFDVPALARRKHLSAQDAGHQARASFFLSLQEELGAQKIAVGHQANDQAETLLMHFLTGAGSEGLSGILPVQGSYIRPLLSVEREDIEEYCSEHGLSPRRDPSNEKDIYLRNKIRNQLVPWLKENINPNLVNTLNRTAQILLAQEEYLQLTTEQVAKKYVLHNGCIKILLKDFSSLHIALQRRLIRSAYRHVGKKQGLQFKHVEEVRELLLDKQVGKVLHLPDEVKVEKEYEAILFYRGSIVENKDPKNINPIKKRILNIPGDTDIPEIGKTIRTQYADFLPNNIPADTAYLPCEGYSPPLYIRARQEGDKFCPYGYNNSKKLKEYFIDKKIPRKTRDSILLLADEKEVIWIPNIALGNRLNRKSNQNKYVVLKIEKR